VPDWFVVNVADAHGVTHDIGGSVINFETREDPFPEVGVNIRVLEPGQPNGKYHAENVQEDFLVLSGECIAIVEGEERPLRAWDFLHCPAGTAHILVGAGDGPCAILMVGARRPDKTLDYLPNEVAARYGASVAKRTSDRREAYADWGGPQALRPTRVPWPPGPGS
jgi:uncharacterized cupin superfamily protein